ncbi:hypothetical protein AAG906_018020 [Vitis piasezkii]
MKRILVDPGSLVDLLQMSAYRQMGYLPYALENPGLFCILISETPIGHESITSLSDVVLPIQANQVTLSMRFSMVDNFSSYNAIMGCAWLHKMKVIPSTYHQMVSYLTEAKQVDLLGSQLATR